MAEAKTYEGGCHCGAVRYRAQIDLQGGISCNCSHCQKVGWLITFVPTEAFELVSGEEMLTDYRFNTGNIAHVFCKRCGIESFARGKTPSGNPMAAINLRCVDGIEPDELPVTKVNGRIR